MSLQAYVADSISASAKDDWRVDISFNKFSEVVYAGIVVMSFPDLQIPERIPLVTTPGVLLVNEVRLPAAGKT